MIKNNNRNFIRLFFNYILFGMVISACSLLPGGMTPEDAVLKTLSSPGFQIALSRPYEEGALVL